MYRMNPQSRAIEEAFLRYGMRYQLVGGTRFYQRREVKDALAYLRVVRPDTDCVAYERIINVPRGASATRASRRSGARRRRSRRDVFAAVEAAGRARRKGSRLGVGRRWLSSSR